MPDEITTLYRPVGQAELDLIRASGFREFPPRLPAQRFFYTVTNEKYATHIAQDWNSNDPDSGFAGYVLRFDVRSSFLGHYEVHTVGDSHRREYWIPAADLKEFNRNIVGHLQVLASYKSQAEVRVSSVFDLGDSDGSDVASNKDGMIGESFKQALTKQRPQ